jgi:hypothetical protein
MGSGNFKKPEGELTLRGQLEEMEELVKQTVRDGSDDITLNLIVEMTIASIHEKRPVFSNLSDEPLFYRRYIYRWVREALNEEAAIRSAQDDALAQLNHMLAGA